MPVGYRRGLGGYLRKETEDEKKNGNGNNNGNGSNGNGHSSSNGSGNGHSNGSGNGGAAGNGGGMSESLHTGKKIKKIVKQLKNSSKMHKSQADYLEKKIKEEKSGDHEPEMIRSQLKTAKRASKRIKSHTLKKDNFKAWVQSKITKASDYLDTAADYLDSKDMKEGSLRKWFKGSKSKDGKGGWVNVVTGGTCASDEPGEGTPKCVSSAKRASMSKSERISAARRKKKADPGQQAKTGASKPTYVSTDSPRKKKMKESYEINPVAHKAAQKKSKMRNLAIGNTNPNEKAAAEKKAGGPKLVGEEDKKGSYFSWREEIEVDECWKTHKKVGMKMKGGKLVPDCRPKNEEVERDEYGDPIGGPKISKKQLKKNLTSNTPDEKHTTTTSEEYIDLPLEVEIPNDETKFKLGLMFRESLDIDKGMLFIFEEVGQHSFHMKNTRIPLDVAFVKEDGTVESIKELNPHTLLPVSSDGEVLFAIEANRGWFTENNVEVGDEIVLGEAKDKKGKGSGTKDACYHKVKSRYSVWPSAYASGALVKCRKKGAANWGNSRKESVIINNSNGQLIADITDIVGPNDLKPVTNENGEWKGTKQITEAKKCWPGYKKKGTKIMFGKRYNNCVKEDHFDWRQELNVTEASAAWQRKSGKSKEGGLNEKGRKSYERQNPGSDLKAPSKKVGNPRRKSFCARMKGMKKKLTSAKTARDPDSRINKSLRAWNC